MYIRSYVKNTKSKLNSTITIIFKIVFVIIFIFGCEESSLHNESSNNEMGSSTLVFENGFDPNVALDTSRIVGCGIRFSDGKEFQISLKDTNNVRIQIDRSDLYLAGFVNNQGIFRIFHGELPSITELEIVPPICEECGRGRRISLSGSNLDRSKINNKTLDELDSISYSEFGNQSDLFLNVGDIYALKTRDNKVAAYQVTEFKKTEKLIHVKINWRRNIVLIQGDENSELQNYLYTVSSL